MLLDYRMFYYEQLLNKVIRINKNKNQNQKVNGFMSEAVMPCDGRACNQLSHQLILLGIQSGKKFKKLKSWIHFICIVRTKPIIPSNSFLRVRHYFYCIT